MKEGKLPRTTLSKLNERYSILAKSKWPGEISFKNEVSKLPLTAARDVHAALEKLPFVLNGLFPS